MTAPIRWFVLGVFAFMLGMAFAPVFGHHQGVTINNYFVTPEPPAPPPPDVTNLTVMGGVNHSDLLSLSSAVLAGGAHQFDYSTTKWQLSLTGDFHTSDWDADNEFSVGLGKRFGKDSWLPNALFHGSYTPVLGDDHITLGVTFVLF